MRILGAAAAILLFIASPASAGEVTPLFAADAVIELTLTGPINDLVRAAPKSTDPYPATLALGAESHAIELSARGNARRNPVNCAFPPLRVKFTTAPGSGSLFRKQRTLKLVTHCRKTASFQQYYLLEYSAYRMLNALTPASYRTRLANVRYVDSKSGKLVAARAGFFVEDTGDMADRVDMEEVKTPRAELSQHDRAAAARSILYLHMIGNHDWSMIAGTAGEDCCHNGKLLGATKTATAGLVYVPFDFDYSGFVDAPYAIPPDAIKIPNVRKRYYRGACGLNAEVAAQAAQFRARKEALYAAATSTPGMADKTKSKAQRYLDGFFAEIADEEAVEKILLKKCR